MNSIKLFLRNTRRLFQRDLEADAIELESRLHDQLGQEIQTHQATTTEWIGRLDHRLEERLGAFDGRLEDRLGGMDVRIEERLGGMDVRIEERLRAVDSHFDQHASVLDARIESRFEGVGRQVDTRLEEIDHRVDGRFEEIDLRVDTRFEEIGVRVDTRFEEIETRVDGRFEEIETRVDGRFTGIETRVDERLDSTERSLQERADSIANAQEQRASRHEESVDQRVEERLRSIERQMKELVSDYIRGVDIRVDDRQAGIDRRIDDRFRGLDLRMDERMEAHELRTDRTLELNREGIIDRTDLMLQIFEQRLDQFRKQLARQLSAAGEGSSPTSSPTSSATRGAIDPAGGTREYLDEGVRSFGKLIEEGRQGALEGGDAASIPGQASSPLYPGIVAWEKSAREGWTDFRPEEREIADYLRSFLENPDDESGYVQQHLRRLVGTIQRIPPPQRSTAQLLELGSLFSLAPAIQRFCGYQSIVGTSWWEGEEREVERTYRQLRDGSDQLTIPIHNFNVEQDPFPFADRTFRVVLCGELIEHLQRDPMHMLWECNRVLEEDGYLLLTTPNITSCRSIEGVLTGYSPYHFSQYNLDPPFDRHHREYAPAEVDAALRAAGFEVLQLETEDVWRRSNPHILRLLEEARLSTELRGDNIFALARKIGPPVERYPKALYVP